MFGYTVLVSLSSLLRVNSCHLKASAMLNATRNDFGHVLIHSIPTLQPEYCSDSFSSGTRSQHTHGSEIHNSFYTWFLPNYHKAGTFCGQDKQMSQDLHTVGHVTCQAQQKPNWHLFIAEQCLASEVPTGMVTATKPERKESKRELWQVTDRDCHRRVKEELTTEPGLGIREMDYWKKNPENPFTLIPKHAYKGWDNQESQQAAVWWLLGKTGQGSISN